MSKVKPKRANWKFDEGACLARLKHLARGIDLARTTSLAPGR